MASATASERTMGGTMCLSTAASIAWVDATVPRTALRTVRRLWASTDAPDVCAASVVPSQALLTPRVVPLTSVTSIRSTSIRMTRSEEHTSELQSLMRISYAVFCLKKKKKQQKNTHK